MPNVSTTYPVFSPVTPEDAFQLPEPSGAYPYPVNAIGAAVARARGITGCVRTMLCSGDASEVDADVIDALWAVSGLLDQIEKLSEFSNACARMGDGSHA